MLTMALETLLDLQPRSDAAQAHVAALIEATSSHPELAAAERKSICGSLAWLMNESIGQAGEQLTRTLEPRRYANLAPATFFTRCYAIRSGLVHGGVPRPRHEEVRAFGANLEILVGDLLAGDLLDRVPD